MRWNGKVSLVILGAVATGFVIGFFGSKAKGPDEMVADEERAITFIGADDIFSKGERELVQERRGQKQRYPESDLRQLVKEALQTGDVMLHYALSEWNRGEDGSGIRAEFEFGDPEVAWYRLSYWAADFPEAAARIAVSSPSHSFKQRETHDEIVLGGIAHLLKMNPDSAVDLAHQFKRRGIESRAQDLVPSFPDWTPIQIERVAAYIDDLELVPEIRDTGFFGVWVAHDAEAAFRWQLERRGVHEIEGGRRWVMGEWAKQDFTGAIEFLEESLQAPIVDMEDLRLFISEVPHERVKELAAWLKGQDIDFVQLALSDISNADPFANGASAVEGLEAELGSEYFPEIPDSPEMPVFGQNLPVFGEILPELFAWPPSRPEEVRGWLNDANDPFRNFSQFASEWTVESVNDAIASLGEHSGEFTPIKAGEIAEVWAREDPKTAIRWASELPPELQIETAETALATWFSKDRQAALSYVEKLPEIEFKSYAVKRLARDWLQTSPDAAVGWIEKMPAGINRDIGLKEVATRFRGGEPQRAFSHANEINNSVLRDMAIEEVFASWKKQNPRGAAEALTNANLPPGRIREIRSGK